MTSTASDLPIRPLTRAEEFETEERGREATFGQRTHRVRALTVTVYVNEPGPEVTAVESLFTGQRAFRREDGEWGTSWDRVVDSIGPAVGIGTHDALRGAFPGTPPLRLPGRGKVHRRGLSVVKAGRGEVAMTVCGHEASKMTERPEVATQIATADPERAVCSRCWRVPDYVHVMYALLPHLGENAVEEHGPGSLAAESAASLRKAAVWLEMARRGTRTLRVVVHLDDPGPSIDTVESIFTGAGVRRGEDGQWPKPWGEIVEQMGPVVEVGYRALLAGQ